MSVADRPPRVVAVAGGVGGARMVAGLHRVLDEGMLTVIVNTGDDFTHWGLHISPDLDTVMYTLAGLAPEERGWGIEGDTFEVLAESKRRGGDPWFQLGDRDLVTHLRRTNALAAGSSLTEATAAICRELGITRPILPMSDEPCPTVIVTTDDKSMAFQDWLVRERGAPLVARVQSGSSASATAKVLGALAEADLVVLCPSNPYVSIDPIRSLDGVAQWLRDKAVVAVSPLVGGKAVKGPLASMVSSIDRMEPSAQWVAKHYDGFLDGLVVHPGDRFECAIPLLETDILIQKPQDRVRLARELLEFARSRL
ncbi:MAG: 2-phospho-L-lactate transferase [Myxococcota bacterium]